MTGISSTKMPKSTIYKALFIIQLAVFIAVEISPAEGSGMNKRASSRSKRSPSMSQRSSSMSKRSSKSQPSRFSLNILELLDNYDLANLKLPDGSEIKNTLPTDISKMKLDFNLIPDLTNLAIDSLMAPRLIQTINTLIDSILAIGLGQIEKRIPIPNIHETTKRRVGIVTLHASFDAEQGTVEDMQTLHRTGDSKIEKHGDTYNLESTLGFKKLAAHFDKYTLKVMGITLHGSITGEVTGNSFLLNVGLYKTSTECKLLLNAFQLIKFDNISVNIQGGNNFLGWLQSRVSTWVVNHFRHQIKAQVENRMKTLLKEALAQHENEICKLFSWA